MFREYGGRDMVYLRPPRHLRRTSSGFEQRFPLAEESEATQNVDVGWELTLSGLHTRAARHTIIVLCIKLSPGNRILEDLATSVDRSSRSMNHLDFGPTLQYSAFSIGDFLSSKSRASELMRRSTSSEINQDRPR